MSDAAAETLAAALEDAIEGMEDMISYVDDYFRKKWGHDAYILRAQEVVAAYQGMTAQRDQMPSEAPREPSQGLQESGSTQVAPFLHLPMPAPPGSRRGHEPTCEAFYGYHCTCQ